tara:strand:- start:623 stop:814 length:192 start_codon:yes stop_codon:yes gene_type:complete
MEVCFTETSSKKESFSLMAFIRKVLSSTIATLSISGGLVVLKILKIPFKNNQKNRAIAVLVFS